MKKKLSLLLSLGYCTLGQGLLTLTTNAQVIPDSTTSTTVDVSGNDFTVNDGDRAGGNLFHSFGEFSVPTNGSVFFNNSVDVVNIFSRVTGGNISNIDGLLGANGTANLYLINPAGIIFGEGAKLDIGGLFLGSTADSIVFPDGEFSATDLANPPLIKIDAPIGLNFRDNPGDIVNRSVSKDGIGNTVGLEVPPRENFTLVGGDIDFEAGNVTARGGTVQLVSLSEVGTVDIKNNGSLNFPDGVAQAQINLINNSNIDVTGADKGSIIINAGSLNLEGGKLDASATGEGDAGNITLDLAENLTLRNNSLISARGVEELNAGIISIETIFLVGFPNQGNGNDIIATAEIGMAGRININTFIFFNFRVRLAELGNGTNDIDASSEFGLDGSVSIFAPPIIPKDSENIINLIESEKTYVQACQRDRASDQPSGLTFKGKGGVPEQPTEPFNSDTILVDEQITNANQQAQYPDIKPIKTNIGDIYPARGIIKTEDSKIILTSYPTDNLNTRTPHNSANCTAS